MQGKTATPPKNQAPSLESLEEQLRSQKEPIIDALTSLFRLALINEYPRMRGYMLEGGMLQASIGLRVVLDLNPAHPSAQIQTLPEVNPMPFTQAAPLKLQQSS